MTATRAELIALAKMMINMSEGLLIESSKEEFLKRAKNIQPVLETIISLAGDDSSG